MLHRHLFLAQQAREHYLQLSAQMLATNDPVRIGTLFGRPPMAAPAAGASLFAFDPFREEDSGASGDKSVKSRFGFAQNIAEMGALSDHMEQMAVQDNPNGLTRSKNVNNCRRIDIQ